MTLSTNAAKNKDLRNVGSEMQHRHFATVAGIIRNLNGSMSKEDVKLVAEHFSADLKNTNAKFDKKRFLAACGF